MFYVHVYDPYGNVYPVPCQFFPYQSVGMESNRCSPEMFYVSVQDCYGNVYSVPCQSIGMIPVFSNEYYSRGDPNEYSNEYYSYEDEYSNEYYSYEDEYITEFDKIKKSNDPFESFWYDGCETEKGYIYEFECAQNDIKKDPLRWYFEFIFYLKEKFNNNESLCEFINVFQDTVNEYGGDWMDIFVQLVKQHFNCSNTLIDIFIYFFKKNIDAYIEYENYYDDFLEETYSLEFDNEYDEEDDPYLVDDIDIINHMYFDNDYQKFIDETTEKNNNIDISNNNNINYEIVEINEIAIQILIEQYDCILKFLLKNSNITKFIRGASIKRSSIMNDIRKSITNNIPNLLHTLCFDNKLYSINLIPIWDLLHVVFSHRYNLIKKDDVDNYDIFIEYNKPRINNNNNYIQYILDVIAFKFPNNSTENINSNIDITQLPIFNNLIINILKNTDIINNTFSLYSKIIDDFNINMPYNIQRVNNGLFIVPK